MSDKLRRDISTMEFLVTEAHTATMPAVATAPRGRSFVCVPAPVAGATLLHGLIAARAGPHMQPLNGRAASVRRARQVAQ